MLYSINPYREAILSHDGSDDIIQSIKEVFGLLSKQTVTESQAKSLWEKLKAYNALIFNYAIQNDPCEVLEKLMTYLNAKGIEYCSEFSVRFTLQMNAAPDEKREENGVIMPLVTTTPRADLSEVVQDNLDVLDQGAVVTTRTQHADFSDYFIVKIDQFVARPNPLDKENPIITPTVTPTISDTIELEGHTYYAQSVISHIGTPSAGHYWFTIKNDDGTFVTFNDSHVYSAPGFGTNATVVLYKKK